MVKFSLREQLIYLFGLVNLPDEEISVSTCYLCVGNVDHVLQQNMVSEPNTAVEASQNSCFKKR